MPRGGRRAGDAGGGLRPPGDRRDSGDLRADKELLGELLAKYATSREQRLISLLPNQVVIDSLNRLMGGYGLIGEVVLDALGLSANEREAETTSIERVQHFFRNIIRRWLRERLQLEGFLASK